ncbi:Uncharacterised protein [Vibrio cholerae]|nr:Uncharacterised protein [Vibrio cholerae]
MVMATTRQWLLDALTMSSLVLVTTSRLSLAKVVKLIPVQAVTMW